jgi:hypothetical protein
MLGLVISPLLCHSRPPHDFLELKYTSTTESIYLKSPRLFWQSEYLAPNFFSANRPRQPSIPPIQREKRLREVAGWLSSWLCSSGGGEAN